MPNFGVCLFQSDIACGCALLIVLYGNSVSLPRVSIDTCKEIQSSINFITSDLSYKVLVGTAHLKSAVWNSYCTEFKHYSEGNTSHSQFKEDLKTSNLIQIILHLIERFTELADVQLYGFNTFNYALTLSKSEVSYSLKQYV